MNISNNKDAALYIRLSKEDGDGADLSESVINQKKILLDYAKRETLNVVDIYIDDGYTGLNTDRPEFNRMIKDISLGKINIVVTKDLSRLSRDYITIGEYTEKFFPEHNVRYVSILDNMDTGENNSLNDFMPFKAVFNEMSSKDTSRKINGVFKTKMNAGEFLGSRAPFGYVKSETEKNKLVPHPEYSKIVKEIFTKYLNEEKIIDIANDLTKRNIPTPANILGLNLKKTVTTNFWKESVVRRILQNDVYTGCVTSHKTQKINFKSKVRIKIPKEEQIKVENMHEAIISKEVFNKVGERLSKNTHKIIKKIDNPLKGLLYCADCGSSMQISYSKYTKGANKGNIKYKYFRCSSGNRYKDLHSCKSHYFREDKLMPQVEQAITDIFNKYLDKTYLETLTKNLLAENQKEDENITLLKNKKDELSSLENKINTMYIDKLSGIIKEEDFANVYQILCNNRDTLKNEITSLQKKTNFKASSISKSQVDKIIKEYLKDSHTSLLYDLVERIEINSNKEILIKFKFKELNAIQNL